MTFRGLPRMLFLSITLTLLRGVLGQHTEAVCNISSLSWTFNSLNQSPCLVAAYLGSPCTFDGDFDVTDIGPGYHYVPPDLPTICTCNTVIYSLLSACAACQSGDIGSWLDYTTNCTSQITSADGTYAQAILPGTAVPHWAYQLVVQSNRFNLTKAQLDGDTPENKTVVSSSSSVSTTPPSTLPSTPTPTPTPTPSPTPSPKSDNHIAAIVGGVVGGVIGLALIGGLITLIIFRNKRGPRTPQVSYANSNNGPLVSPYGYAAGTGGYGDAATDPRVSNYTPSTNFSVDPTKVGEATSPAPTLGQNPQPNNEFVLYNPDDPSTFPTPIHPV